MMLTGEFVLIYYLVCLTWPLKITGKPWCNTEFYFDTDSLLDHSFFVHGDTEEMMSEMVVLFENQFNFPLCIHYEIG